MSKKIETIEVNGITYTYSEEDYKKEKKFYEEQEKKIRKILFKVFNK